MYTVPLQIKRKWKEILKRQTFSNVSSKINVKMTMMWDTRVINGRVLLKDKHLLYKCVYTCNY